MTPTRYPGWRFLGFILGAANACMSYGATLLYYRMPTSLASVGWVRHDPPATAPHYHTLLLMIVLTAGGALLSTRRPAWGFLLLGAGYVVGALSVAVLFFPVLKSMVPAVVLLTLGVWYSRLGFKELDGDRGSA